jgi:hypothetical protein
MMKEALIPMHILTSAYSMAGKFTKITTEEAAKYIGVGASDLTPEMCIKQYKEAWNENNKPNPVNTTMTAID